MSCDSDEQINERYVLEAMYESDPRLLFEDQGGEDGVCGGGKGGLITVKHLLPITLNFVFPWDYPSVQAPIFTLSCDWLSRQQLSKLCQRLDEIWEENRGQVILYTWFQFLEDEAFEYLGITSPLDLSSVVKSVVTAEEYERYDKILLRITLETMSDVVYCPRRVCQSAVICESNSNMGRCPQCSFVFCTLCKLSYHGPTPCRVKSEELQKLCREYTKANSEKKQFMEKQYGKRTIQKALEETDSAQWLEQNAKTCPYCGTQIQKKDGCNKMTCTKCRSYFCWLCNEMLSRSNPYGHYSNPASPCNSLLFEGTGIADEDDEWWDDDDDWDEEDDVLIFL
nr:hypothetical protein BaRGS_002116 [Batillaria attramentaria]